MVIIFGISTMCTAFVKSFGGLVATRVFLGIAEGGTLVCWHSSFWVKQVSYAITARSDIYSFSGMSFHNLDRITLTISSIIAAPSLFFESVSSLESLLVWPVLVSAVYPLYRRLIKPLQVGGLLASGILAIDDFGIITSWRKIFFIEGNCFHISLLSSYLWIYRSHYHHIWFYIHFHTPRWPWTYPYAQLSGACTRPCPYRRRPSCQHSGP